MKRVQLTEGQFRSILQKVLNENIAGGMLVYGSEDAQINSEEDLDNYLSQYGNLHGADFKDAIMSKINMGDYIVPVGYGPYGNVGDWAVIEFFKAFHPDNIVIDYAYNGGGAQYGFIWGDESFLNTEIETATDDYLAELEGTLVNEKIEDLERQYGKKFDEQLREIVWEFLSERVCAEAIDYSDSDLEDILREEGYLQDNPNESLSRRVTESVIRRLNEWGEDDDWDDEDEDDDEDDEPNVQYFADLLEYFDAEVVLNELEQYLSTDEEDALIDSLMDDWDADYHGLHRGDYQYLTDLTELCSPETLLSAAGSYFGGDFTKKAAQDIMHTLWWN